MMALFKAEKNEIDNLIFQKEEQNITFLKEIKNLA